MRSISTSLFGSCVSLRQVSTRSGLTKEAATLLTSAARTENFAWPRLLVAVVNVLLTLGILAVMSASRLGLLFFVPPYWRNLDLWSLRALPIAVALGATIAFMQVFRVLGIVPGMAYWARHVAKDWRKRSVLVIAAAFMLSLIAVWVLRAFPNSGDEYAYLFQAKTFLAGHLWNPLPPIPALFDFYNIYYLGSKWVTLYNPGWPLILGGGIGLGLPSWLVSPFCGALLLFAVVKLGARRDGPLGALLTAVLVPLSPFFLLNAASYFEHVSAAAAGVLFCWAATEFLDRPRIAPALLAGAGLGALGLIRSVDVPIFGLPFAIEFVLRARRRHYELAPLIGTTGLPFLAALIAYNVSTSGTVVPDLWRVAPTIHFGLLPVDEFGNHMTFLNQLGVGLKRLFALAEWVSPLLVLGTPVALIGLAARHRLSFVDLIFPAFVIAYLLVPFNAGNQYGPRYYFEGFPTLVLTIVSMLVLILNDVKRPARAAAGWSIVIAHGALSLFALGFASYWMHTEIVQRMDLYDQVAARNLRNAVVIVHSSTGVISPMSPRDLVRNGIEVGGDVIYALDRPGGLAELRRLFPQRQFYVYRRADESAVGSLLPLLGDPVPPPT